MTRSGWRARMTRPVRVVLCVACALVLAGCQTTAWVRVGVNPDGTGSVAVDVYLDHEAAARVGDLSKLIDVGDLKRAGWTVTGPAAPAVVERQLGGSRPAAGTSTARAGAAVQIHLEHPFANVDEANEILASLSADDGPFRDVMLTRHTSLFSTSTGFTGTVDLRKGLRLFSDEDLDKVLGDSLEDTVEAAYGSKPKADSLVMGLQIVPSADMKWSGDKGNDSMGNATVAASAGLGEGPEHIDVHSRQQNTAAVVIAAIVIAMMVGGLVVAGVALRPRIKAARHSPESSAVQRGDPPPS